MKVAMMAVLVVLASACGGAAGPESKVQRLGAAGGVITLESTGARIEVPAGAVSSEVEFRVSEAEVHGARRAIRVETSGKLEHAMRVHFLRPDGVAATETLRVVRVDDEGGKLELSDDRAAMGEPEPGDDAGGAGEVEPGDDNGGAGQVEAGDDKGHDWTSGAAGTSMDDGTFALEVGDDNGSAGEVEAGDDNGVDAAPAPVDDSGKQG
jgi:hypothetical protein